MTANFIVHNLFFSMSHLAATKLIDNWLRKSTHTLQNQRGCDPQQTREPSRNACSLEVYCVFKKSAPFWNKGKHERLRLVFGFCCMLTMSPLDEGIEKTTAAPTSPKHALSHELMNNDSPNSIMEEDLEPEVR